MNMYNDNNATVSGAIAHVPWQELHIIGKSMCRQKMNESEMT